MKNTKSHRIIAAFFLLIFFPTVLPVNLLYASNNGPVAPEATAFEPVDATDMVNLSTGDMSYVLPLLNVPSPEGGYPLALSYHAGVAMEQEASWVGLGWNLNPGAINRSVQGFPDDWGNTRISSLVYDQGQSIDQYNFSIGGTLPNGISLGMSKSWGAYKAWGGTVAYSGIVNASFGSNSVGFGIPGMGYNYDLSSGEVSGGISYGSIGVSSSSSSGMSVFGGVKYGAVGISMSSTSGISVYPSISSPVNITSTVNNSVTKNDYYIRDITHGFNLNANLFWISYQHRNFSYKLYKKDAQQVNGVLNLYATNKVSNSIQDKNSYMDVKAYIGENTSTTDDNPFTNTMLFPNYDNYFASAQGISGSFSPKIFDQIMLYDQGDKEDDNTFADHINDEDMYDENGILVPRPNNLRFLSNVVSSNNPYKLNNKLFFYFDNVNSSFLRTSTGGFIPQNGAASVNNAEIPYSTSPSVVLNSYLPQSDNTFTSATTINGDAKKNGNRKRDGNFIEAFTNEEIKNGQTNGWFLEVPGYDRNNYTKMCPKGIGGYRITTLDGKTYHYSLPVYHFEDVYKNYVNETNENSKFFESIKTEPYATHWLLTAVTGADYVDFNNNNKVDAGDYGYWVDFEYGKWSEGFGWKSPKSGAKKIDNKYVYFWGRKELYYLDKIKTRTHTALFVKSMRSDDKSADINKVASNYIPGSYTSGIVNKDNQAESFTSAKKFSQEYGTYYKYNTTSIDSTTNTFTVNNNLELIESTHKFVKLPVNFSLKLDKILLLKNEDAASVNKGLTTTMSTNRLTGISYFDYGFTTAIGYYIKNPWGVKKSNINCDQNVLDIYDIAGLNLESKAIKYINLNYDYSLGQNLPNSTAGGRLALKNIGFRGKGGTQVIPPYVFNYAKSTTSYNRDNADVWGYVKDNPDAWSLNEIITPMGGKIKINYEDDSYFAEAVTNSGEKKRYGYNGGSDTQAPISSITKEGDLYKVLFNTSVVTTNLNDMFVINDVLELRASICTGQIQPQFIYREAVTKYLVNEINNTAHYITFKIFDLTDTQIHEDIFSKSFCNYSNNNSLPPDGPQCLSNINIARSDDGQYTQTDPNGKKGGGLRVNSVETIDEIGNSYKVEYNYRNPVTNRISGITSYTPFEANVQSTINFIQDLPAPNVMYNYVTVNTYGNGVKLNKTQYEFKVLESAQRDLSDTPLKLGDMFVLKKEQRDGATSAYDIYKEKFIKNAIISRLSSLGSLLSVKSFNAQNQLLSSTKNNYKYYDDASQSNGAIQETFSFVKRVCDYNYNVGVWYLDSKYTFGLSSKIELPNVLESITTTQGGYTNTVYYDKYDFLTGQSLETRSINSYGESTKTTVIPAYKKYAGMAAKVDNVNNKNMLSQSAVNYSYILDPASSTWKETGVGITTWSNIWTYRNGEGVTSSPSASKERVWRKDKSYTWIGVKDSNGIFVDYNNGNEDNFDWTVGVGTQPTKWKKISEVTMYDHFSLPLEVKDINNNYAATKTDINAINIIANGNAGYGEMFYSGAENGLTAEFLDQEVHMIGATVSSDHAHTGKYSVYASPGSKFGVLMRSGQHRAGKYMLSVWVLKTNAGNARVKINNNNIVNNAFNGESYNAGDWVLKTYYFDAPVGDYTIDVTSNLGNVYYDDLRVYPVSSSMASYVYNDWNELTYILGNNNLGTRFEYDTNGRLIKTYSEIVDDSANGITGGFKLASKNQYHYKNQ